MMGLGVGDLGVSITRRAVLGRTRRVAAKWSGTKRIQQGYARDHRVGAAGGNGGS